MGMSERKHAGGFRRVAGRWLGLVIAVAGLAGCGGGEPAPGEGGLSGRLTITGSSTVAPLMGEIAHRFEAEHPGVRIDVQSGGSSQGIADARRGTAEIGMASRALAEREAEAGTLLTHTIARDGIALIVNRENRVESLTSSAVRDIYTGRTGDWIEVGGREGPITVVNKAAGRGTLRVFLEHFELDPGQVEADVVVGENQHAIRTVSGEANAIGYVSIGAAEQEIERGVPIRMLRLDGVGPTPGDVAVGRYPLTRALNLITRGEPGALAGALIEFATSPAVHDLVEAQGFVPPGD